MSLEQEKNNKQKWHSMNYERVLEELKSDIENGLTDNEVNNRAEKYGLNKIPQGKKRGWFVRLLMQFHNVLIYVLMVAAVTTALMNHWVDTWVILSVVVINAIIGFIQEGKAEKALDSIRKMLSLDAVVVRDKKKTNCRC